MASRADAQPGARADSGTFVPSATEAGVLVVPFALSAGRRPKSKGRALRPPDARQSRISVDFLDPGIAPGVGTTIPGGPNYREAQLCMEMIADSGRLGSLDIMELNPALDVRNQTALLAVDLVESLFGKSTLMRD